MYARRFLQLFALWTAVAILFALQWFTYDALHGHPSPVFAYLRWNMEQWYTWLLLSPLVFWLAARRPIDPRHPLRALPLHLLASVLFALAAVVVNRSFHFFLSPDPLPFSIPSLLFSVKMWRWASSRIGH
jgi:two-component system, LytTR family, sensor kinase